MVNGELTNFLYADKDEILGGFLEIVSDASTWVTECALSDSDKDATVVCLAEISGAARLAKKLLMLDEVSTLDALKKEFTDDIG